METKKYTLPDMVISRYSKERNAVIRWKNKSTSEGKNNIPEIDVVSLCDIVSNLDENDVVILKSEMSKCWTAFFEAVEDYVYPILDNLQGLKLDD